MAYLVMELAPVSDRERITDADDPAVAVVSLGKLRLAWHMRMELFRSLMEVDAVSAIHFNFPDLIVTSIATTPEEWLDELDGVTRFFKTDALPATIEEVGAVRTMIVIDKGVLFEVLFADASSVYHTPMLRVRDIKGE